MSRRGRMLWVAALSGLFSGVVLPAGFSAEVSVRPGQKIPGIIVETSETDPDLKSPEDPGGNPDENRRAVNRPPRLLKTVPSEYPEDLKGSGVVGEVMVSLMVDRMGRASHLRVEQSPDGMFTEAALDALSQWEFLPALRNSRVTNSRVRVNIMVSEEMGDSSYFDFTGGRITLEGMTYAGATEHEIKRLFGLRPVFPFEMLVDAKPGEVMIEFSVGEEGVPYDTKVLEATHKEFSLATQAAMAYWKFSPALHEGNVVAARLRYRVSFQPDEVPADVMAMARRMRDGLQDDFVSSKIIQDPPKILRSLNPVVPEGVQDTSGRYRVTVGIVVTPSGEVLLPRIEAAPDPLIGYSAATVVSYWRFSPAYKDRQPVQVNVSLPIAF